MDRRGSHRSGALLQPRPRHAALFAVERKRAFRRGCIDPLSPHVGTMNNKPLRIDIWSDVVCPWCWIGKQRLRTALAQLGEAGQNADIHWHAFQLDPESDETPVPLREAYERKFGGAQRTEQILAQTQAAGRAEGLPFDFDRGQVRVNTLKAHRLVWLAGQEGDADKVGEALFHAHFAEGR